MKIRTDFVTNSSSSSFVAFKIKSKKLVSFLAENDILPQYDSGGIDTAYNKEELKINVTNEGGTSICSVDQALAAGVVGKHEYYDETDKELDYDCSEYKSLEYTSGGDTDLDDFKFSEEYDTNTAEGRMKAIYEVLTQTNALAKADVTSEASCGGGEMYDDDPFGYRTSGYSETIENGVTKKYAVHPYVGGFGYEGDSSCHYIFSSGDVTIRDREGNCESNNVVWDNETADEAINKYKADRLIDFQCAEVTEITLPKNYLIIANKAIENSDNLKTVKLLRRGVLIGDNAVPAGVKIIAPETPWIVDYAKANGCEFEPLSADELPEENTVELFGNLSFKVPYDADFATTSDTVCVINNLYLCNAYTVPMTLIDCSDDAALIPQKIRAKGIDYDFKMHAKYIMENIPAFFAFKNDQEIVPLVKVIPYMQSDELCAGIMLGADNKKNYSAGFVVIVNNGDTPKVVYGMASIPLLEANEDELDMDEGGNNEYTERLVLDIHELAKSLGELIERFTCNTNGLTFTRTSDAPLLIDDDYMNIYLVTEIAEDMSFRNEKVKYDMKNIFMRALRSMFGG